MENQSKDYFEIKDYIFLQHERESLIENIKFVAFVKVFGDHARKKFLSYLKLGFYFNFSKNDMHDCIKQILAIHYSEYEGYEVVCYFKDSQYENI